MSSPRLGLSLSNLTLTLSARLQRIRESLRLNLTQSGINLLDVRHLIVAAKVLKKREGTKDWCFRSVVRNFGVDRDTLVKAGKAKANVQFPNTSTYQAGLEAFHQLHCLVLQSAELISHAKSTNPTNRITSECTPRDPITETSITTW